MNMNARDAIVLRIRCAPATVYIESRLAFEFNAIHEMRRVRVFPDGYNEFAAELSSSERGFVIFLFAAAVISAATLDTKRIYDRPGAHSTSVKMYGKTQIRRIKKRNKRQENER